MTLDELDCPVLKLRFPHSGICDLRRIRLSCTKTKVLLTPLDEVYVTLDELDCPVLKLTQALVTLDGLSCTLRFP